MSGFNKGYEFTVIEDRVKTMTVYPSYSKFDRLLIKLRLKKLIGQEISKCQIFTNRWYCVDLKTITSLGEVRNNNGKTYLSRCAVFSHPDNQWVVVKARYSDIKNLLYNRFEHNNSNSIGYGRQTV